MQSIPSNVKQAMTFLKGVMPKGEFNALCENCRPSCEEHSFFWDKFLEMEAKFKTLPDTDTYQQNELGIPVLIHYFHRGWDWWITRIDKDEEYGYMAWGLVSGFEIEYGRIWLQEIINAGAELDLYFQPKTLREIEAAARSAKGR